MAEIGTDILKAKNLLEQGELVAIPTETVYGLAGNALNASAVAKIFTVKSRPQFDPLIVHVPNVNGVHEYVADIPEKAYALAQKFWPGPLTLLLEKKSIVPDHPLTQDLLKILSFPLAAPSANPFGYVSPTSPQHVNEQLGNKIKYILDGGKCEVGIESTIVGIEEGEPVVYRMGGLSIEDIESVIGKVKIQTHSSSNPRSPGQLESHYAPVKKVFVGKIEELLLEYPAHHVGLLTFQNDFNTPNQYILSPSGTLEEAAQNLFEALRAFDKMDVDVVFAELVPDVGIGRAINDRLKRAAASADRW